MTSCLVEQELGHRLRRKTGRRFGALDAMRGIAAISVMFFHYLIGTSYHVFERAFYAVDLFFVLSAFVLMHSYGAKIGRSLNFTQYIRLRLIRLYPLYLIGTVLGMCIIPMYIASRMANNFGIRDYILSSVCAFLFLPYPNAGALPLSAWGAMVGPIFPFDIPAWSLFFELLASIGLFFVVKNKIKIIHILWMSFIVLTLSTFHYHTLNVGFAASNVFGGFARTTFTFSLGILFYNLFDSTKNDNISVSPLIFLFITAICLASPESVFGWQVKGYAIWLVLIANLACCALTADTAEEDKPIYNWLGRISYGVYAIHLPIYLIVIFVLRRTPWASGVDHAPLTFACLLAILVIASSHLLTSIIDEPLRQRLKTRFSLRALLESSAAGERLEAVLDSGPGDEGHG